MKKILLLIFSLAVTANVNSQTLPDNWTGDSGIDTYQESTTVHGGTYSCKVVVNTGTQGNCDMRNDEVSVTAGESYTYSFWGYTSEHVKIRSVLEWTGASITYGTGYIAANSGGWIQKTETGTVPSGATGVKIGVRFYDVSGFSAGEIQYIDDFTFESPTGTPVPLMNGDMESWPSSGGPDNPSAFTATTVSTSEIDLSWTRNAALDSVMVVKSYDNTFGAPVDGEYYSAGDTIPGGDTVLCRYLTDTTYQHTGLNQNTTWYYKAWSVDGSANYSSGTTTDATTNKLEPSNHVASFTTGTPGATSIPLSWLDNDGAVAADYFLVMINTTGTFTTPVDGTPQADDTDVSDGSGQVNIAHGDQAYTWSGLSQSTHYYFTIYPYTNSGSAIDFKTDGTVPTTNATTTTANTDLIISEVSDPEDVYRARFVELYNTSTDTIFFNTETWYLVKQSNGGSYSDIELTDTVPPGEAYTVAYNATYFNSSYGTNPDQVSGNITGNGNDGYYLYFGGDESSGTLIDAYGVIDEDGGGTAWEYSDGKAVRKRSVGSPNSTWTASEWLITRPADTKNMTPGQHMNYVTWQGTTDTDWDTKTNWDNGFIPDVSMNVTIPSTANNPVIASSSFAACWDIDVNASATLTIEAASGGQGSLLVGGTPSGNATVKNYVTAGQWHSITAPVSGETAHAYYLGGTLDVWLKGYNEATEDYTYVTSTSTPLGDMKGWMIWVGGSTDTTFSLSGSLRSGPVGSTNNMVCTYDTTGYNFVGNPYTSALDWDATSGWTKTNLENAIYVYNSGNWASYVDGTGVNGGSRYIAMNQGFFVRVDTTGSTFPTNGTLQISRDACVHNSVSFLKSTQTGGENEVLRLKVDNGVLNDETVIRLSENATDGFDGNLDAYKLFSFDTLRPQIYSTANGLMSINSIPPETGTVALDVRGANGDNMTIAATSYNGFAHVYLTDEQEGTTVDLTQENYSFIYSSSITNRFTVAFTVTGIDNKTQPESYFKVVALHKAIRVTQPNPKETIVSVYNLLGQTVATQKIHTTTVTLPVPVAGYYLIRVTDGQHQQTQKIFIR